jgi:hypothetical protein
MGLLTCINVLALSSLPELVVPFFHTYHLCHCVLFLMQTSWGPLILVHPSQRTLPQNELAPRLTFSYLMLPDHLVISSKPMQVTQCTQNKFHTRKGM